MSKLKLILGSVLIAMVLAVGFSTVQAADQGNLAYPIINDVSVRSGPWMRGGVTSTVVDVSKYSRFGICVRVKNDTVNIKNIYYAVSDNNVSFAYPTGASEAAVTLNLITALGTRCATFTPVPSYYVRFLMIGGKGSATGKVDFYLFRQ